MGKPHGCVIQASFLLVIWGRSSQTIHQAVITVWFYKKSNSKEEIKNLGPVLFGPKYLGAALRIASLFMGERGTLLAARHNALMRSVAPKKETVSCKHGDVFD